MRNILTATAFIAFSFYPYLARADTNQSVANQPSLSQSNESNQLVAGGLNPSIPDISGWTVVNTSRIELRISDNAVAFIGLEIEYNNPADSREFVWVIRRHIPLIISKQKQANERLLSEMVVVFYTQKEEQDRLLEVSKKSDPIVYIRWRTKENQRTSRDMLSGDVNIWFLPADGNWLFRKIDMASFEKNKPIDVEFLTENVGNGKPYNVFAGTGYRVGNAYHIIRVDRSILAALFQGGPALRSSLHSPFGGVGSFSARPSQPKLLRRSRQGGK